MRFISEPGVSYDLMALFTLRFNGENWYSKQRTEPEGTDAEAKYYMRLKDMVSDIPDSLMPFFYLGFNETMFFKHSLPAIGKINASAEEIIDGIGDEKAFSKALLEYYFPKDRLDIADRFFLTELSELLGRSDIDVSLRYYILNYFLNQSDVLRLLRTTLLSKLGFVRELHEKNRERHDALISLYASDDTAEALFSYLGDEQPPEAFFSICFVALGAIEPIINPQENLYILGVDSVNRFRPTESGYPVNIFEFGRIVSDKIRLRILTMLHDNGELYTTEIKDALEMNMTTAYYHLSMMQNEGVVKTRNVGRRVYYSINIDYIKAFQKYLNRYTA